jgi:hypothetical protein
VSPAGARFSPRAPTKTRVDVAPGRLATYALRSEGAAVRFTVALLPRAGDGTTKVERVEEATAADRRVVTITGRGWSDDLVLAPAGEARTWRSGALAAEARLVVARSRAAGVEELLLVGARHVSLPGVEMSFDRPAAAEFRRNAQGTWICDFTDVPDAPR